MPKLLTAGVPIHPLASMLPVTESLLTVPQHLYDVLLDHGQDDLATQAAGDPVQGALPSHSIAVKEDRDTDPVSPKTVRTSQTSAPPVLSMNKPVKVIVLQLVRHGPLVVILQVHHHGQHLGHCRLRTKGQNSVSMVFFFPTPKRRHGSLDAYRPEPRWPCASAA